MNSRLLCVAILAMVPVVCAHGAQPKGKKQAAPTSTQPKTPSAAEIIQARFARWDQDRNDKIDRQEINAVIENPAVQGQEAAVVVTIYRRVFALPPKTATGTNAIPRQSATLTELLATTAEPGFGKAVAGAATSIKNMQRALFLPSDPNLSTFHQGRLGDCYLVATIAAAVVRDPRAIRLMFAPAPGGGYDVHFGNGRLVHLPSLSDAELALGAKSNERHGNWLNALEKAYAQLQEEKARDKAKLKGDPSTAAEDLALSDLVGRGGAMGPVISALTGHRTKSVALRSGDSGQLKRMDQLLKQLSAERKLMVCSTPGKDDQSKPKVPGVPRGHAFAVLGYDAQHATVHLFNPWGNNFTPKGAPGIESGYLVRSGHFNVPLKDFLEVWRGFVYETEQDLPKPSEPEAAK